jgi:hypothetical protein
MNKIVTTLLMLILFGSLPAQGGENYNIDSLITSVEKSFARVNSYTCLLDIIVSLTFYHWGRGWILNNS